MPLGKKPLKPIFKLNKKLENGGKNQVAQSCL